MACAAARSCAAHKDMITLRQPCLCGRAASAIQRQTVYSAPEGCMPCAAAPTPHAHKSAFAKRSAAAQLSIRHLASAPDLQLARSLCYSGAPARLLPFLTIALHVCCTRKAHRDGSYRWLGHFVSQEHMSPVCRARYCVGSLVVPLPVRRARDMFEPLPCGLRLSVCE
jgi:hypothetical protein